MGERIGVVYFHIHPDIFSVSVFSSFRVYRILCSTNTLYCTMEAQEQRDRRGI